MSVSEIVVDQAEKDAYRAILAALKESIKGDAVAIRADKQALKEMGSHPSAAVCQGNLSARRVQARAALLVYGSLRGRSWDRMEPKRKPIDSRITYWIAQTWKQYRNGIPMPESLTNIKND